MLKIETRSGNICNECMFNNKFILSTIILVKGL